MSGAEEAVKIEAMLAACIKARKYLDSPEAFNKAAFYKRQATIARRKPIYDTIRRQQKNWERGQNEKWLWWRIQNTPDEILYEPFFRRLRLDDWSR